MALSDWTQYVDQNWSFLINVTTPIISSGTGRLAFTSISGGTSLTNIVVTALSGRTKGVTKGKLRTLFRYDVPPPSGSVNWYGLAFMMSAENAATGSGNHYRAQYNFNTGRIELIKALSTTISGGSVIAQGPIFSPGNNVTIGFEVEWIKDIPELGGVAMFVKYGFATDYSDLTPVITYIDTTSPFLVSVAESIFAATGNPGGALWNLDFDQTTMFIP